MPSLTKPILVAGIIIISVFTSSYLVNGMRKSAAMGSEVGIAINPEDISFGTVAASKSFEWSVRLKNPGPETVDIHSIRGTCSCTEIQPKQFSMASGATEVVSLKLDLTRSTNSVKLGELAAFEETLTLTGKGDHPINLGWVITGKVYAPIRLSTTTLRFPEYFVNVADHNNDKAATIQIEKMDGVKVTSHFDPDKNVFESVRIIPQNKNLESLEIVLRGDLPVGNHNSQIKIEASDVNGLQTSWNIPVRITAIHPMRFLPRELSFGRLETNSTASLNLSLSHVSGTLFVVTKVSQTSQIHCEPSDDQYSSSHTLKFAGSFPDSGVHRGDLGIEIKTESGQMFSIDIPYSVDVFKKSQVVQPE